MTKEEAEEKSAIVQQFEHSLALPFFGTAFLWDWNENWPFPVLWPLLSEKAEEPETKLPTSIGSSKKQESSRKTSISALLTMPKTLIM